ncbi:III, C31 subunit of DNA-directed RNA polymerase [Metschnikowia bicuspidata var. bicuspidata NRRL YB-4993]|uniref:DNA-directed RNA polymerase III subunit n=1 Tax=Metschnikowia bicuspidata var. bicuspidata NRRL YB-4993 TaxID=869754 RepID=A0A1A0HB67_9ASCO|nr:III, C31 subunit of DNA-directed RNA polymerase [Metschnikowia bicuspidata var. bicuspidata NRRL YB-4993]OBA21122.1 III, C31 subunit of DNA-directed RNA polymerase [Metschnikowia bicuspidata var. bicuspidata NRRL YB-4993]
MSYKNKSANRVLLPFGLDYADVLSQGQETEGPTLELPVHGPLSASEELCAKQALALAKLLYDGPFYTGPAEGTSAKPAGDSIERYSDRYKKVKKVTRSIDEYPYQLGMFPEELYSVMGITNKKKKLLLSSYKTDGGFAQLAVQQEGESAEAMLEKLKSLAEDLDADPNAQQNEEDVEEEDFDDEFEEEDDDDYNAEKYFDDGDDDMGDAGDDEAAF